MGIATNEILQALFSGQPVNERMRSQGLPGGGLLGRIKEKNTLDVMGNLQNFNSMAIPSAFQGGNSSSPSSVTTGSGGGGGYSSSGTGGGAVSGGGGIPFTPGASSNSNSIGAGAGGSGGGGGTPRPSAAGRIASPLMMPGAAGADAFKQGPSGNGLLEGLANGTLTVEQDGRIVDLNGRPVGMIVNGVPMPLRR